MTTTRRRWLGRRTRIVVAVGALVVVAVPSAAGGEPAADEPVFGIRAGLHGQTTLPGDHFTYDLEGGSSVDDFVVLYNFTDEPLRLALHGADVEATADGTLAPAQAYDDMAEVGDWLSLDQTSVTIGPDDEAVVDFRLDLPAGTPPGDYVGAVVAVLEGGATTEGFRVETRAARLIRLRVVGEADLGVEVSTPSRGDVDGGDEFEVVVRNTGNVLFTVDGAVAVTGGPSEVRLPLSPEGIYVVPGGEARFTTVWRDLPWLGRRSAAATVDATVGSSQPRRFTGDTSSFWYIPWWFLIAVGAVLGGLIVLFLATRRRRRARRDRRREERAIIDAHRRAQAGGDAEARDAPSGADISA